ncbi:MAG TPA: hypothetical protein VEZ14_14855 [Dehalococcoidia bacterium]|nr:hypothetical protein [Dehalococcoidia bacterium]
MKAHIAIAAALTGLALLGSGARADAQAPVTGAATAATASATPAVTPGTAVSSPTATITVRPTPPPEPAPPTPGPPTATPQLPEQGGPPGGVLGGHLYVDNDGSRSYTPGDTPAGGGVGVNPIVDGSLRGGYTATGDTTGYWEVRALPDGLYRVGWDASGLPAHEWPLTTPPVETINLNPLDTIHDNTVHVITRVVEIRGANRILDINFGIPLQSPVFGAGGAPRLPATGSGGGAADAVLLYVALGASVVLALGGVVLRRRGRG